MNFWNLLQDIARPCFPTNWLDGLMRMQLKSCFFCDCKSSCSLCNSATSFFDFSLASKLWNRNALSKDLIKSCCEKHHPNRQHENHLQWSAAFMMSPFIFSISASAWSPKKQMHTNVTRSAVSTCIWQLMRSFLRKFGEDSAAGPIQCFCCRKKRF